MRTDRDDRTIRESIRELRQPGERITPAFEAVLARTPRQVRWPVGRLAFLAAVVLGVGIGMARFARGSASFTVPREVVALSAWRAPTDVLLETPISTFLTQTRSIDSTLSASRVPLVLSR